MKIKYNIPADIIKGDTAIMLIDKPNIFEQNGTGIVLQIKNNSFIILDDETKEIKEIKNKYCKIIEYDT